MIRFANMEALGVSAAAFSGKAEGDCGFGVAKSSGPYQAARDRFCDACGIDARDLVLPPLPDGSIEGGSGQDAPVASAPFKETVADFERRLLRDALMKSGGNKAAAGRLLGLDENQIRYLCRKHGLG